MKKILLLTAGMLYISIFHLHAQTDFLKNTSWQVKAGKNDTLVLLKLTPADLKKLEAQKSFVCIKFIKENQYQHNTQCFSERGSYTINDSIVNFEGLDAVKSGDCKDPANIQGEYVLSLSGNKLLLWSLIMEKKSFLLSPAPPEPKFYRFRNWISNKLNAQFFIDQGYVDGLKLALTFKLDSNSTVLQKIEGTTDEKLISIIKKRVASMPVFTEEEVNYGEVRLPVFIENME